jgi:hypothetical protein
MPNPVAPAAALSAALALLERYGVLLEADAALPSLATLLAGESIRGSWWGHPAGKLIFNTAENLADRDDVLRVKLVNEKVTFVHRALWPALLGAATTDAAWQHAALGAVERALHAQITRQGEVRLDTVLASHPRAVVAAAAKGLETRLLVLGHSLHTDSGAHVKVLTSWARWRERVAGDVASPPYEAATRALETAVAAWPGDAKRTLPWQKKRR